jgi:hypothetical protein
MKPESEIPDSCLNGDHDFGQAGRCQDCGVDRADTYQTERRSGGAGSLTNPTTDAEYREEMRKLEER